MRRMREDESGSIAVMVAFIIFAMFAATALAVDIGRVGYTSRDQQGVTDRAVLDAIQVVAAGGATTLAELHGQVTTAIGESMDRNPGTSTGTARDRTVVNTALGQMDGVTFTAICDDDPATATPSCADVDADASSTWTVDDVGAVRADTSSFVDFIFAIGDADGGRLVERVSVAATEAVASISVGSRLAELDLSDSNVTTVLDEIFAQMLVPAGVSSYPSLTSGYDGLVNATIPLGDIAGLDASLLSPRSVVPNVAVGLADLLDVMASGLDTGDPTLDTEASTFLTTLRDEVDAAYTVDIAPLLYVTTEDEDLAAGALVNVWDVLVGTLLVANMHDGLTLDLALSEPFGGLLGMSDLYGVALTATVVQAPRTAIGSVRGTKQDIDLDGVDEDWWATYAQTAQVDLDLTLEVGDDQESVFGPHASSLLGGLLDTLTSLLCLLCADDTENVDVSIDGAKAMAGLSGIGCDAPSVTTDVYRQPLAVGTMQVDSDVRALYQGLDDVLADEGTFVGSLEPTGSREEAVVDPVPGSTTVGYDTPTTIPMLDTVLEPVLAMLGTDLGTATVWGHWVDCDSRRLAYIE